MTTATKAKAKDRGVKLVGNTLTIRDGKKATDYTLEPVEGADCLAFNLHKQGPEPACYTVQLAGRASACDCWSALRWGHQRPCKHVACLLALQRAGRLPEPPACRTCGHGRAWAQHGADAGDCCPDCGR